ncbi:unnamed protein product [Polarella glacialis]|uniref:Peptidase S54 rhomboid domain-containing protein n=1 Tax=Polarella glacialis TaxID=89957 RepID=A0A813JTY9_POLGL|nr:unnamed protein product [Polarella glacialis]
MEEESLEDVWLRSYVRQRREPGISGLEESLGRPEPWATSSSSSRSDAPAEATGRNSEEGGISTPPSWHLALGLVIGVAAWLQRTVPSEASLEAAISGRYGREPPAKIGWLLLGDRSFSSQPEATSWTESYVLAVGRVSVRHEGLLYEHRYVGLGGRWFAMPYLPRVHLKGKKGPGFRYGLGLCYKARCICIPDKKAPCKQLIWDTNSLLSLVLGLNISLFFTGLWAQQVAQSHHEARVGGWSLSSCLIRMSTLSLPGLWDGQWSALFLSAFYHRGFLEFIRNMALLANVLEGAAQYGSWMFLALYIGGSVAHFVGACAALRVLGPEWLVPLEVSQGCRGGLSSILALFSKVKPGERFKFSLYMVEIPTPLPPLAMLAANALLDASLAGGRGRFWAELAGHAAALGFGLALSALVDVA